MNLFRAFFRYFFPAPPPEAKPSRTYDRGLCPDCGAPDVALTKAKRAARRWHKCSRTAPEVVEFKVGDPFVIRGATAWSVGLVNSVQARRVA